MPIRWISDQITPDVVAKYRMWLVGTDYNEEKYCISIPFTSLSIRFLIYIIIYQCCNDISHMVFFPIKKPITESGINIKFNTVL